MKSSLLLLIALISVAFGNEVGTTDYTFRVHEHKGLAGMTHLQALGIHEVSIGYFEFPDPDGDTIPGNNTYLAGLVGRWRELVVFDGFYGYPRSVEMHIRTDIHGDTPYLFVLHHCGVNAKALRAYRVEECDIIHIPLNIESSNMASIVVNGNRIIVTSEESIVVTRNGITGISSTLKKFEYLFDGTTAKHIRTTTEQILSQPEP